MMQRYLIPIIVLSSSVCFGADRPPNIVHIVGDDVGYDDLSCYGAPKIKTPNLDKLASQGMRFTNFYAPSPTCTPTRAALMTGCYAQRVGLPRVLFPNDRVGLHADEVTIAELLKKRGYATACIGKWHLGHVPQHLPTNHGFDLFFGIPYPNDHGPERDRRPKNPPIPLIRQVATIEQPVNLETLPDRFVEEAVKFMTENKDKPFFLHFSNIETHTPWFVPKRFEGQSADGAFGDAVQCMDWMVGQVMETLEKLKLAENTLVVFTTDNGPLWQKAKDLGRIYGKFGDVDTARPHLLRAGKYQGRWEGGTRVPAIARWPGKVAQGTTCDELAAGFDLYNTFAAAAGARVPDDRLIDGVDLAPLLTTAADMPAKPVRETLYYYENLGLAAVRKGDFKLVLPGRPPPDPDTTLLFNVREDPGETKDLATERPELVAELQKLADEARKDLGDARTGAPGQNRRPSGRADDGAVSRAGTPIYAVAEKPKSMKGSIKPAKKDGGFAMPGFFLWCPSVIKVGQTYHMFASRWPAEGGIGKWTTMSECVRAESKDLLGPYEFKEVVLTKRPDSWDNTRVHNGKVVRTPDGKFVLYHIDTANETGYAVADSVEGPWKRLEKPVMRLSNPAPLIKSDGSVYVFGRLGVGEKDAKVNRGIAFTTPRFDGEYTLLEDGANLLPDDFELEDPTIWWANSQYNVLVNDWKGKATGTFKAGTQYFSKDGQRYVLVTPEPVFTKTVEFDDGSSETFQRRERPFVYTDEKGAVIALFTTGMPKDNGARIIVNPVDQYVPTNN